MRLGIVSLLLLAGCATKKEYSPEEAHALNSCFYAEEQRGWHYQATPPEDADELRKLIAKETKNDVVLETRGPQYWFTHDDGRRSVCSLFSIGNLPNICSRIAYVLVPSAGSWQVEQQGPIICYERG